MYMCALTDKNCGLIRFFKKKPTGHITVRKDCNVNSCLTVSDLRYATDIWKFSSSFRFIRSLRERSMQKKWYIQMRKKCNKKTGRVLDKFNKCDRIHAVLLRGQAH